jgi:hypothetical protein
MVEQDYILTSYERAKANLEITMAAGLVPKPAIPDGLFAALHRGDLIPWYRVRYYSISQI